MKKSILILLCVALPLLSIAQPASVRKIFRQYGHEQGTVKINLPGIVMDFAALFVDDHETAKMLRGISKIRVLATDDETQTHPTDFGSKALQSFKSNQFEELLSVRSDKDDVAIYMKEGKRNKKELLIIAGGSSDNAIVYLKGKVDPEMLGQLGKEFKVDALKSL